MTVRCKREGALPEYRLDGTVLTLQNTLSLDLAELARDEAAHVIVSEDRDGALLLGCAWRYVAEIDLPARRYRIEKIGFVDDFGYPALRRVELPFATEDVVLTLWAKEEGCK